MNHLCGSAALILALVGLVACSKGSSNNATALSGPTPVDGTYYTAPVDHGDGAETPEGIQILKNGTYQKFTVHDGATIEESSTYSVSGANVVIQNLTAERQFDCNGLTVTQNASEDAASTVSFVKTATELELSAEGETFKLPVAKQEDVDRILALPKCTKLN